MSDVKPKYVLEQVRPSQVGPIAKHILPLVEKACEHSGGRFDARCVFENCAGLNQRYTWYLWVVFNPEKATEKTFGDSVKAIAVTALADYPTGLRFGETLLIGGHGPAEDWLEYIDGLKDWARKNGAHRMQYIGRRAWQRKMRGSGINWKPVMTMFEHDLEAD